MIFHSKTIPQWHILLLFILFPFFLTAQQRVCDTHSTSDEDEIHHQILVKELRNRQNAQLRTPLVTTYLAIKPHLIRKTDGTGAMSLTELNDALSELNRVFKVMNVEFYFAGSVPNYINDDNMYNGTYTNADEVAYHTTYGVRNAHNVYFSNSVGGAGGYSYGSTQNQTYNKTYIRDPQANDDKTLAHEIGHYLNLSHTFRNSDAATVSQRELVTRSLGEIAPRLSANCATQGDFVCDTPADPRANGDAVVTNCVYAGTVRDANNDLFSPSVNNIMDYNFCDPYLFTVGQYARMQNALLVNNTPSGNATTSYTLDAPETAQTAPSNVTATLVNASTNVGNIVSWTDNSSVEMGYIIERATSLTGSYEPIGGVAANIITFTDATPPKNATAYYRVKPSNSKNNYSLIANVSTPLYCGATYSSPCTIGATTASHIIRRFKVATTAPVTLFDNDNSGCSANSYGDYYNTFTANVAAGSTYNFYMNTFYGSNGYFPQHLGIFIDINKDGDFEDAGEQVFRSTGTVMSGTTSLDGTFTVPAGAFNGSTRLRVRCRYNSSEVTAACGSFTSGETEDYKLIITGGLVPVELVDFTAKRANSTVKLYWQTATEHLNKGFQIERSADGLTFENIGFVDGKGDSKALNYYDFTDADPLSINYYRLRQMDFDGTETVSKVVTVFMDKLNELAIYPNPTKDHITIRLHTYNDAFLRVIDVLGREILRKSLLNEASDVDMSQFKSGNYIFEVQLKGQVLREKVVKY